MTGVQVAPAAPETAKELTRAEKRAQERQGELVACLAEVNAVLERYDATIDVSIVTNYRNGQATHVTQVLVVPK